MRTGIGNARRLAIGVVTGIGAVLGAACGDGAINIPALAPIVNAALPAGLKLGSTPRLLPATAGLVAPPAGPALTTTLGAEYVTAMFRNYFVNGNPPFTQGYLI